MIKAFLTLDETAAELSDDLAGLLQAIEIGRTGKLPFYVRSPGKPLLALLIGTSSAKDGKIVLADGKSLGNDIPWGTPDDVDFDFAHLSDGEGKVKFYNTAAVGKYFKVHLRLDGFFRVDRHWLIDSIRAGGSEPPEVTPSSWWGTHQVVPKCNDDYIGPYDTDEPEWRLQIMGAEYLIDAGLTDQFAPAPSYLSAYTRISDLRRLQTDLKNAEFGAAAPIGERRLSSKERTSAMKLIMGMARTGWGYDPARKRSPIPKEIADDLCKVGIEIDDDTVRNWLAKALTELS